MPTHLKEFCWYMDYIHNIIYSIICCSQNIGRLSIFHQGGIRERSFVMQAKVPPRGLLLRFDTCKQVHTINPCVGQRLSLLQESEDLRGWHSVSVPQQLDLSGAAGLGAMPISEYMHVYCVLQQ